ncbi:MAG TPA: S4 domain-containing protein YaaA [Bacillota bacterium]|nr:S4 domain-containing protein YaaA [Bacillota bacterium]HOA15346.1 S4 domain-containing protein YaaA [Bacillota bacterium]HOG53339.1 S4 domain-containing protein YaaA [Bacillota bacterium]
MGARRVSISTEYIQLDQLLKWAGLVMTGGEAKENIIQGKVSVNGEVETRRGRKLREGDVVAFMGQEIEITKGRAS